MGNPEQAKIFLLNGNPNVPKGRNWNNDDKCKKIILNSLEHKVKDYPLYALSPDFEKYSIYEWWYNHLSCLIEASGLDLKIVSKKIFAAEYFPYFSDKFPYFPKKLLYFSKNLKGDSVLKSQEYTFGIIKKAMKKGKWIVIMRAEQKWYDSIEGLREYDNLIVLKDPGRVYVSPWNMKRGDFKKILKILKGETL